MTTAPAPGGPSGDPDDRLQLILDAFTTMAASDDEDGALERAVDVARLATRAVYGAAVLGAPHHLSHLVHAGMTQRQVASLPGPPHGHGVLGAVLAGRALRLERLGDHVSAPGLPARHPPMDAFLGVPVVTDAGEEVVGAFYLAKPPGHPAFTDADQALVVALARQCAQVVVRLRAARQVQELAARLEATGRVRASAVARMTSSLDPVDAVDVLLDVVREQLGMPLAALMRVRPGGMEVQRRSGSLFRAEVAPGCTLAGPQLCHRMLEGAVSVVPDVLGDPELAHLAGPGIGAYAGAPVVVEGRVHGSLCVLSDVPSPLTDADAAVLGVLADLVAVQLTRLEADAAVRTRREAAVAEHLEPGGLRMVLQPVVDLVDGRVVAVEALARPSTGTRPDRAFAEAAQVGLGVDLELAAVAAAVGLLPLLPDDVDLSLNAGPGTVEDPRLLDLLVAAGARRVVVELTEHEDLADRPGLAVALERLRLVGARIAIDDAGAGFAGLRSIVDVAPDVLKLDIGLVRGIDADPARRSLVRALVALAEDLGAALVAEGVETAGELEALRRLGVGRGQGFFLGVPADPADVDLSPRPLLALPAPRRG